jgi:RNA polymerase sigma-70 factor (ECF subfamily)
MEAAPLSADALLRHEAFVLRLARSLVRNEASAEDIAQETLLSALEHRPPSGTLRSWLARVTRHRALDHLRGEHRRTEREARAARGEAIESGPSAQERLELEHRVVSAVLSLDEPYRSVVIAAFYEGLAPNEIARRRRVAAGTVRSQLSRALEQLREKLDRGSQGDREIWSAALLGLLRGHGPLAAAATASASSVTALTWVVTLACVLMAAGAFWWVGRPLVRAPEPDAATIAVSTPSRGTAPGPTPLESEVTERAPVVVDSNPQDPQGATESATPSDLPSILERVRTLKAAILRRRLEIDPEANKEYAWLEGLTGAGVTRLIERAVTGYDLDLPGMDGGGSYFSFTREVHDWQRSPQIGLDQRRFRLGIGTGAVVELGPQPFRQIASASGGVPQGLGERFAKAWRIISMPYEEIDTTAGSWLQDELRGEGFKTEGIVRVGHTYLLRAIFQREFDVIVAFEVAAADEESCTIAWRILESRIVSSVSSGEAPAAAEALLSSVSPELLERPESELRFELDALRGQGERILMESFSHTVSRRFANLLARKDAGLTRLVARGSPWSELPRVREGGAYYSFATRSSSFDDHPDVEFSQGLLSVSMSGASPGVIIDLGQLPLEEAVGNWSRLGRGPAFEIAAHRQIDHFRPREEVIATLRAIQKEVIALRAISTEALLGHSYLLRSIDHEHHDLLVVLEVVGIDDYGIQIAWQQIQSWPVPRER